MTGNLTARPVVKPRAHRHKTSTLPPIHTVETRMDFEMASPERRSRAFALSAQHRDRKKPGFDFPIDARGFLTRI